MSDICIALKKICMKSRSKGKPKIQPETLQLMEYRKRTRYTSNYQELNKRIHKEIRKGMRMFHIKIIENAIKNNANMRCLRSILFSRKHRIAKMKKVSMRT